MKKCGKILKRIAVVLLALFSFVLMLFGVLELGVWYADTSWTQWRPNYEQEDLTSILAKTTLTEEDYDKIYRQTGLTKLAVDDCIKMGRQSYILRIQKSFFQETPVYVDSFAPFSYMEMLDRNIPFAPLQDGDILLSAATRFSFFRYGHSALVVDGAASKILEIEDFTCKSGINSATVISDLASFVVLRPKLSAETKKQVAESAKQELIGLDYSLLAGIFGKKYKADATMTQCAHLVWSAYMRYGIDLDGDGGKIIKPKDFLSDKVEVVQVYGLDLDTLWR